MRPLLIRLLFTAVLPFLGVLASAQDAAATNDSPAVRRAREIVQLVSTGDRKAAAAYIEANFSEEQRRTRVVRRLDAISRTYDLTRGLEIHSVETPEEHTAKLLLKGQLLGDWHLMTVKVEAQAPHRIAGIGLLRGQPPEDVAKPAAPLTDPQKAEALDAWIKKLVEADVFSGAVLLAKGDTVIFKGAYGLANKDFGVPNRIDTKFNLGSMNKMFTAVAVAQLVERGKVAFTDPIAKFVPDFPDAESAQKVQVRHLLSHTSGLGSFFNQKFQESSRELYRTVDEMMKLSAGEKLAFEPGTKWQYSNTGMLVAGKVVQVASGQDYFDYIREHVYQPAGMTNSDCYELDRVNTNLAVGYDKEFGDNGATFRNNIFQHVMRGGPAGGGYSTVEDLHRFALALRANKLVGKESVELLLSPKPELNSPEYGYGFALEPQLQVAGHSGGFPGISSNLDMFLGNGYIAIVMSNYGRGSGPVENRMRELVMAEK